MKKESRSCKFSTLGINYVILDIYVIVSTHMYIHVYICMQGVVSIRAATSAALFFMISLHDFSLRSCVLECILVEFSRHFS